MHSKRITIYNEPFSTTEYYSGEYNLDNTLCTFTLIINLTNLGNSMEVVWVDNAELLEDAVGKEGLTDIEMEIFKLYDEA